MSYVLDNILRGLSIIMWLTLIGYSVVHIILNTYNWWKGKR